MQVMEIRKRSRDENERECNALKEQTKPWSFYKLIISPDTQFNQLRIPEVFARKFIKELSATATATLTVPTGETWKVNLVEEDDKLWFGDGWKDFVTYFSIDCAFFLLFTYEGNSNFRVHIFDPSACEIGYTVTAASNSSVISSNKEILGGDSVSLDGSADADVEILEVESELGGSADADVEILEVESESESELDGSADADVQILEVESELDGSADADVEFVEVEAEHDENVEVIHRTEDADCVSDDEEVNASQTSKQHICSKLVDKEKQLSSYSPCLDTEKTGPFGGLLWVRQNDQLIMKVLAAGGIPKPENPFYVSVVKAYYLHKSYFLPVPTDFVKQHLSFITKTSVKVEVTDGRQWIMDFATVQTTSRLGKGFITFARQIKLEIGDVCFFELVDVRTMVLKVHIVKKKQVAAAGVEL